MKKIILLIFLAFLLTQQQSAEQTDTEKVSEEEEASEGEESIGSGQEEELSIEEIFKRSGGPPPPPEEFLDIIEPYFKILIDHPEATCMDGTQSTFYYHPGNSTEEVNPELIIHFYSGGFCVDNLDPNYKKDEHIQIDDCTERVNSYYGSTKEYPDEFSSGQGIMSNSRIENPLWARASKVWIMYCDGQLWFKQMNKNVFIHILKMLNNQPKKVILSGAEVGAIYLMNEQKSLFEAVSEVYPEAQKYLIIDNGILLFRHQYIEIKQKEDKFKGKDQYFNFLKQVTERAGRNIEQVTSLDNLKKIDDSIKVFIVQPQYDFWQFVLSFGFDCHHTMHFEGCNKKELKYIHKVRKVMLKRVLEVVKTKKNWGLWMIGCVWHETVTWNEAYNVKQHLIPWNDGVNLHESLQKWYTDEQNEGNHLHYDVDPWPGNESCSHLKEHLFKGVKREDMADQLKQQFEENKARQKEQELDDEDL